MGAAPFFRSMDALEWVCLLSAVLSALCLLSLAALMAVDRGRRRWRRFRRDRKKLLPGTTPE